MNSVAALQKWSPFWSALIPILASTVVYALSACGPTLGKAASIGVSVIVLGLVASMYPEVESGRLIRLNLPEVLPPLGLSFQVDASSCLIGATLAAVWSLVVVFSTGYMAKERHQARYYAFQILNLGGCIGVALAGDLFTLFVFFETVSLAAYALIVHDETPGAMAAGFKYLTMSIMGSLAFFFAVMATYSVAGTLTLETNGIISERSPLSLPIFLGFAAAFAIKSGLFPLHVWLPDAHSSAPSSASALLSGLMVKAGIFGMGRVINNVFGWEFLAATWWPEILIWASALSMIVGSGVAVVQEDLKRRLAYSTVGQAGYMVAGLALMNQDALFGTLFHMFAHALAKACLFLCAGGIAWTTGTQGVRDLAGIGRRMPITMGAFTVAALSLIGIPPLNGFVSKWALCVAALEAGRPLVAAFFLLSSMLACAYSFPIIGLAFFGRAPSEDVNETEERMARICELPLSMLVPIVILALGSVAFSVLPETAPMVLSKMGATAR